MWIAAAAGAAFAALLASVFASFGAATGGRLAVGESLAGRSHCVCGTPLGPTRLVPAFSWLAARGRARCCGSAIPTHLLLGELIAAVVAAVVCLTVGLVPALVAGPVAGLIAGLDAARRAGGGGHQR